MLDMHANNLDICRQFNRQRSYSTYIQWNTTQSYKGVHFESVLMRWMNLEPIIQSEVSQKEKNVYCILMYL